MPTTPILVTVTNCRYWSKTNGYSSNVAVVEFIGLGKGEAATLFIENDSGDVPSMVKEALVTAGIADAQYWGGIAQAGQDVNHSQIKHLQTQEITMHNDKELAEVKQLLLAKAIESLDNLKAFAKGLK